ncbi:MAG: hypothetical protein NTV24_03470 [Candidatus Woesebacteria bacterium]|nr:hypothetical protein [Candidatus Woesebacteria bacterium]
MSKKKRRISADLPGFDEQIRRIPNWLNTIPPGQTKSNGERLGMTTAELVAILIFLGRWFTGDPANRGAYELHTNPATKTKDTAADVQKIKKEYKVFFQPILVRMSGSPNITSADRIQLNIAEPVEHRTRKTKVITTLTSVTSVPVGPGEEKLICTPIESDTEGISGEADSIQVALVIVDANYVDGSELSTKVQKTAPEHVGQVPYREIHTKSENIIQFDHKYRGHKVYVYARQYDVRHPELAGPWSEVHTFFIP